MIQDGVEKTTWRTKSEWISYGGRERRARCASRLSLLCRIVSSIFKRGRRLLRRSLQQRIDERGSLESGHAAEPHKVLTHGHRSRAGMTHHTLHRVWVREGRAHATHVHLHLHQRVHAHHVHVHLLHAHVLRRVCKCRRVRHRKWVLP